MSEDPLEGWLPPKATGGSHPAGSEDEYRPPSPAQRRRAALGLWLDGAAILTAALLASLHLYVFSAWLGLGDQSACCSLFVPSPEWLIVILCVLNAIGAMLALLAGFAALVRGTRFSVAGRAPGPCAVFGLSGSATLLIASFSLYLLSQVAGG